LVMRVSVNLARKLEKIEPQLREVLFAILEEIEKQRKENVTREDLKELTKIVKELATAQKKSEERMAALEERMEELAAAQRRTEERVEELAAAQRRTEERVEELAAAQKRTEERMEELAAAQRRTEERMATLEERMEELAAAQRRTEEELQKLIQEHRKTREQVGGLSITVGYILEDRALKSLPSLLEEEFGLKVEGKLVRRFIPDARGEKMEVNIFGKASKEGERFVIIGEGKAQLSKNRVKEFINKKVKRLQGAFSEEIFPILITYMTTQPDVEEYARNLGIKRIFYSYEFPLA